MTADPAGPASDPEGPGSDPQDPGSDPEGPGRGSNPGSGWYYYLDLHGAQQGPIHVSQLARMVGSASPQSALFWQNGWAEWKVRREKEKKIDS